MKDGLNYSIMDQEGNKIVKLNGHISNVTKGEFEQLLYELIQKNNVIINMEEVNILTSSGLNSLINICSDARSRNKRVVLLRLQDDIIKMMKVMDVCDHFIFVESIEEGQMKIRHYT